MKKIIPFLFLLFTIGNTTAQTTIIQGSVIAETDRQPITGATIRLKGSTLGTVSDIQGRFSLPVPDTLGTLVISFIGMKTQETAIHQSMLILMQTETQDLDEAVITAMGIKRDWKSLGYASTVIEGDELTQAREGNFLNALAGKVAGVRITQSSGTPGGSSKIQIRGASSIASVSSPLFIIDGMPIDNTTYNPDGLVGNIDAGNRAGDISADDIESINVLKGAAATALYGARAKDGAIIITTKRGNRNSATHVTVNSSTRFEQVAKLPDYQNEYAQGSAGAYNLNASGGWGPKVSEARNAGTKYLNHKGEDALLEVYPNNIKDFFQTGISYINNISLTGGNEKTDFRAGISSYNQTGTVPGTDYNRYNFSINAGTDLFPNLSARITSQYILSDSEGALAQGSNDPNILLSRLYLLPRTIDINYLKNNWIDQAGKQILTTPESLSNNPFWTINKNKSTSKLDRFIGNMLLTYSPITGLTFSNNAGIDSYHENRRKIYARGTIGEMEGKFQDSRISKQIINNDFILTYEKAWGDFSLKGIAGHNIHQEKQNYTATLASRLTADDIYNYAIAKQTSTTNYFSQKRLTGVYFDLGLSYKSLIFLNVTGRNDWSSTLPLEHRSYFYPSVSSSFVFSELIKNRDILNFGKLRINYAKAGSDADPYQLKYQFTPVDSYELQYSIINTFPHNGLLGLSGPTTFPLSDLKPQIQKAFEIGTELMFLDNRIHLDFTYYHNATINQIISVRVPASSGYYQNSINAGKVTNKGFEVMLGLTPLKFKDFRWDITTNFAANKQVVNEITEDLDTYTLARSFDDVTIRAEKGKSFGLYGTGWARYESDELGEQYIIDKTTGLRKTINEQRLGSIYPKFTMGISNQVSYKGFTLNFLIDIRQGGKLFSATVAGLRTFGLAAETAAGREQEFIEPGVIVVDDETISFNDVPVKDMETYWGHISNTKNAEGSVFDASYVKLRELTFSYQFPRAWFNQTTFVKSLHLGIEGRNLWLIKSHVPHIDPEVNAFGPSSLGEGIEYYNAPSSRSLGLNIKLTF